MEVIGLLGPAGSGKDLVADWLVERNYVKVAFADVMKRLTLDVFNMNTAALWGPSQERNKPHEVNWQLVRERLTSSKTFEKWSHELLNYGDPRREELVSALDSWFHTLPDLGPSPFQTTARIVLQTLGTEMGRNFDPLLWVNYVYQHTLPQLKRGMEYHADLGVMFYVSSQKKYGVVVPDHRFKNEVEETQKSGGYVIRLRRPALEAQSEIIGLRGHASENEQKSLDDSVFDLVLNLGEGIPTVHTELEQAFAPERKAEWMTPRP